MSCDRDLNDLLTRLQQRDRSAITEMTQRYYAKVQSIVHRSLRRDFKHQKHWLIAAFSTGDVVNEVFVKILENPAIFAEVKERTELAFTAYLAQTVHYKILDAVRYEERACRDVHRTTSRSEDMGTPGEHMAPFETPSANAVIHDHLRIYREVRDSMPERERTLLIRRLEEEDEFANIADAVGFASADVARRAFNRAKATMLVRMRARGVSVGGTRG